MPRASAYSPSRLAVFQACRRRYYYQYVIKLARRREAAQSVGISLHAALEAIEQAGGLDATGLEGALSLFAERWEGEGFESPEAEAAARKDAEAVLQAYLATAGEEAGAPVMVEQKLKGSYGEVPLFGIVDRVDRLPNGSYALIDYKSGREAVHPATLQQLAIYRHLVTAKLGRPPAEVAVHHLPTRTKVVVEAEWEALLQQAADTARAIEAEQDFDPCVGGHCRLCDYRHRCLAFQAAEKEHSAGEGTGDTGALDGSSEGRGG